MGASYGTPRQKLLSPRYEWNSLGMPCFQLSDYRNIRLQVVEAWFQKATGTCKASRWPFHKDQFVYEASSLGLDAVSRYIVPAMCEQSLPSLVYAETRRQCAQDACCPDSPVLLLRLEIKENWPFLRLACASECFGPSSLPLQLWLWW